MLGLRGESRCSWAQRTRRGLRPSTAHFSQVSLSSRRGIRTGNPVFPRGKVQVESLRTVQFTAFGLLMAGPAQSEMVAATCPLPLSAPLPPRWAWGSTLQKAGPRLLMLTLALSSGCPKDASEPGVSLAPSCLPYFSPFSRYPLSHPPGPHCPQLPSLKKTSMYFSSFHTC